MRRLAPLLTLLVLLIAGPAATVARASATGQLSIMMDDDRLIYRGDAIRDQALDRMRQLGVDYVRVTVLWSVVAADAKYTHPRKHHKRHKRHFVADNPRTYPHPNWDRYDNLVRAAHVRGIGVYFNVTGPGPRWAMGKAPHRYRKYQRTWKPNAHQFFKFVKAVGKRYSGTYRDENNGRTVLPRVGFWSIYNEPNQPGWLTPQYKGSTPYSPIMYRRLWNAGRTALDQTGHTDAAHDIVLIGETAPLGSTLHNVPSPMYPKKFMREFFCLNSSYHRYTGASARRRDCGELKRIGRFDYTAWAHHPYTKKLAPTQRDSNRDSITIANIGELPALLDRVGAARPNTLPAVGNYAALTEFGYETNPPDPFSGVSPDTQATWINQGDYLAYKDPRVISNTQFQLYDVKGVRGYKKTDKRRWFTYQSGLYYASGKPKPAVIAYRFPFLATGHTGSATSFWGWTRFLPYGYAAQVLMQFKPAGSSTWQFVGDPVKVTNPNGFFEVTEPVGTPGSWRAVWVDPISHAFVLTREVSVP